MSAADLVDAAGVAHTPAGARARIVSLVPSLTELVFDLGLGDRLVGRTGFCIHPAPAVDAIPKVGGTKTVRLDRLRALAPTHVLVNVDENRIEDVDAMREFVPHVVVTHPVEPRDNPALYRLLGALFDAGPRAEALCRDFEDALERLQVAASGLPPREVVYLIWRNPWMTVSRDTYISRTLGLVGWETLGHDPAVRYPAVAAIGPLLRQAGLVLLSSEPFPFRQRHVTEVRRLAGGRAGPVGRVIDAEMVSWYGSRAIPGLDYLARFALETDGGDVAERPLSGAASTPARRAPRPARGVERRARGRDRP